MTFSFNADLAFVYCCRRSCTSTLSLRFCARAVTRPSNQLYASRNGRATRSVAISNGRRTAAPAFCALWTGPLDFPLNDSVISTSESRTSPTTTILRLNGDRDRDESGDEAGR